MCFASTQKHDFANSPSCLAATAPIGKAPIGHADPKVIDESGLRAVRISLDHPQRLIASTPPTAAPRQGRHLPYGRRAFRGCGRTSMPEHPQQSRASIATHRCWSSPTRPAGRQLKHPGQGLSIEESSRRSLTWTADDFAGDQSQADLQALVQEHDVRVGSGREGPLPLGQPERRGRYGCCHRERLH